jgi:hypothetical protein
MCNIDDSLSATYSAKVCTCNIDDSLHCLKKRDMCNIDDSLSATYSAKVDVFSATLVMWFIFTGDLPFAAVPTEVSPF